MNKYFTKNILIVALSSLFLTDIAFAYKAPRNPSRPKTTTSNATRNDICFNDTKSHLTLLAPVGHIGQSVSQQPTFSWFLPDSKPRKMTFSIFEYVNNKRGNKIKSFEFDSKPGSLMKFSPSQQDFTFQTGKTYLWQISYICDRNNPINDVFREAVIEIIPKSPILTRQISQATTPMQRAQVYADAGLWYDAFAEVYENPQAKQLRAKLLATLSKLETESANNTSEIKLKDSLELQALELQRISVQKQ
ncbi:hypothetical protein CAL7716_106350 (plasmid) [Calothrix sp. PCC 7716]|nr:hypothetical protein CAL7716_106350 [Calothrix sp. PCC 7716]